MRNRLPLSGDRLPRAILRHKFAGESSGQRCAGSDPLWL